MIWYDTGAYEQALIFCSSESLYMCILSQLTELKLTVEGLEKERDFYFGKLRDIEVLCQEVEAENLPVIKSIMDILYATEVGGASILNSRLEVSLICIENIGRLSLFDKERVYDKNIFMQSL